MNPVPSTNNFHLLGPSQLGHRNPKKSPSSCPSAWQASGFTLSVVNETGWKGEMKMSRDSTTLQRTNISHLGKLKIIFKIDFSGDMLVPRRVGHERYIQAISSKKSILLPQC